MKAVMSYLRQEFNLLLCYYIDDTILIGDSPSDVEYAVNLTRLTLTSLGFTINSQKSVLIPMQKLEFLGFDIDSSNLSVSVPQAKVQNVLCKPPGGSACGDHKSFLKAHWQVCSHLPWK